MVGVSQTGPALSWSGRASPVAASAASNCSGEWVERPTRAPGACQRPGLGDRRVVLADVNAVGAARLDQLGVVVQEEERAVAIGGAAKRLRERDELLGAARRLLAELDHVGAAAKRGVEERLGIAVAGPRVADEVEAGGLKALRREVSPSAVTALSIAGELP